MKDHSWDKRMNKRHRNRISIIIIALLFALGLAGVLIRLSFRHTKVGDSETPLSEVNTLATALITYHAKYAGYPQTLSALGPPPEGVAPNASRAGLTDKDLASGNKGGYRFSYHPFNFDKGDVLDHFTVTADPISGSPLPHYFVNQDGIIHMEAHSPATVTSPSVY